MSSLPSFDTENEPKIARSVEKFFKDYKVMELLRRCGLRKSMMTMGWTDGSSFVPIASSLLSSKND
ncbi:hypothetical protein WNX13_10510, partial [Lactobacillus delbrueckii]